MTEKRSVRFSLRITPREAEALKTRAREVDVKESDLVRGGYLDQCVADEAFQGISNMIHRQRGLTASQARALTLAEAHDTPVDSPCPACDRMVPHKFGPEHKLTCARYRKKWVQIGTVT